MKYPSVSEYRDAIKYTSQCFKTLKNLNVVEDSDGNPTMNMSDKSLVFKMRDKYTGILYALKCFLYEDKGRKERYREVVNEMQFACSGFLVHARYLEDEFVMYGSDGDTISFPVVIMDWAEGTCLDKYLQMFIGNPYPMRVITAYFCSLAMSMRIQNFVHGDISADNILVRHDCSIVLIDYDKMALRSVFNGNDDISLVSIALSLKAMTLCPSLYEHYDMKKYLLFSEDDWAFNDEVMKDISSINGDAELEHLMQLFNIVQLKGNLEGTAPQMFKIKSPSLINDPDVFWFDNDEEEETMNDEFGVQYSINGKSVLSTSDKDITGCIIKDGAEEIRREAFIGCNVLKTLEIPYSVRRIESNPFSKTGLEKVVCHSPNYVVEDCFLFTKNKEQLVSYFGSEPLVTIPSTVRVIGENAFAFCESIREVVIPASVEIIEEGAFSMCKSLSGVAIPPSVTFIGNDAFSCCAFKNISIPASVKRIGSAAFYGCTILKSVELPPTIRVIKSSTFTECSSLETIVIPSSVEIIEEGAFSDCKSLREVVMPGSITTIGGGAFTNCTSLKSFEIPSSVTSIESNPFINTGLESLVCKSPKYIVEKKTLFTKDKSRIVSYIGNERNYDVPESVTIIGESAFQNCYSLYITLPSSVIKIEDYAFSYSPYLKKLNLPPLLKDIGNGAFHECKSLESIIIPQYAATITPDMFYACCSLECVTISSSVTDICCFAFSDCTKLKSIDLPSSLTSISEYAFCCCSSLSRVVIRSPFMDLEEGVFEDCTSLSEIVVPRGRGEYYENLFKETGNDDFTEYITED